MVTLKARRTKFRPGHRSRPSDTVRALVGCWMAHLRSREVPGNKSLYSVSPSDHDSGDTVAP